MTSRLRTKLLCGTGAVRAAADTGRGWQGTADRELLPSQKARISHLAVSAHTDALVSPEVGSALGQNVHFYPDHISHQLKAADVFVLVQTPIEVWL